VALVAIATAERMGCPRRVLAQIGVAALLHDTGHEPVAGCSVDACGGSPDTWSPVERALVAQHPLQGMRHIAAGSPFDRTTLFAMQVALGHHSEQGDMTPPLDSSPARHVAMVAIADAYVTLLAACDPTALALTPYETLGRVLGPLSGRFSAPLRAALVEAIGVHPPGQMVRLDDGSVARVLANTPGLPTDPYVELLTEPSGRVRDDAGQGAITLLPEGRAIVRVLPLNEWPVFSQAA
jgi:HD-GYP domain-containing protein (c-di-GMP phosphodiesterase class II)